MTSSPRCSAPGHAGWALMNAIHDALRRDLDELLRTTASRMAARARWIVFRDQLRFYLAAEQAAILGDRADDDGLRAVVAELEAAEPGHRGNCRRGSRSEPATLSRSRSLSPSRSSQDLAGPRRADGDGTGRADISGGREYLVLARVLLAQDRPGPGSSRLLERLHAAAAAQDRAGSVIEIRRAAGARAGSQQARRTPRWTPWPRR